VPAAAVIPAPIAYIKVVAVKKLVVELRLLEVGPPSWCVLTLRELTPGELPCPLLDEVRNQDIYFEKIRVFKAGLRPNTLAWNNRIGRAFPFCWFLRSP
jgi:hypothetical protein